MNNYLISIYYKNQPPTPSNDQLLDPAALRPGDRFTQVFHGTLSFRDGSDRAILQDVFAMFNNPETSIPGLSTPLPRSMSVGDIICGLETIAYLITENGFQRLPFRPRNQDFEITAQLLDRPKPTQPNKPLRHDLENAVNTH